MRLAPDGSLIERELVNAGMEPVTLHLFEELNSTSVWLREQFMGRPVGSVDDCFSTHLCATNWQTAGIARRGKTWQTKPGNITFSVLSTTDTPAKDLLGLSLVSGIGIADCLQGTLGVSVQLKWPNDVLVDDAKLGGLLTEISSVPARLGAPAVCEVLTGIGVNFLADPDVLELGIGATSLEKEALSPTPEQRDELIGKLAASVLSAHQCFYKHGWRAFADRWKTLDWLLNKNVMIHSQQTTEQAVARGVDEQGALLVERDGSTYPVYSGEVSIRPTV
ncbi:MAG: BirA family biotin operon repressor/biotin-[acetyl-CoA-carboxylase] ligase [Flavobacteriaceae bacterium]|jgi:BirA family biotin operon repressor/biotin-[acetyl-CoA-carboxylase] ligase